MAEADPRGAGRRGAEQVAVVTLKTRFALLASSVWRYSLAIPPLTHLPTYRSRYSATLHSPLFPRSPLAPYRTPLQSLQTKSVAYFAALTLGMHFARACLMPPGAFLIPHSSAAALHSPRLS